MAGKLEIEIVTPSRKVLSGTCDEVYLPGPRGEFGILPEHAPFVSTVSVGAVRITEGNSTQRLAVKGGFLQVLNNRIMVLADQCVLATEINKATLDQERAMIEKKLVDPEVTIEQRVEVFIERDWLNARQVVLQ